MNKDEKQQWDIHTLNGQVVAVKGEPRAGAEMRSLAGMCDLANALQQQVTELEGKAALLKEVVDWSPHESWIRKRYAALTSPSTIAQKEMVQ